jgi:hypothetical protein
MFDFGEKKKRKKKDPSLTDLVPKIAKRKVRKEARKVAKKATGSGGWFDRLFGK